MMAFMAISKFYGALCLSIFLGWGSSRGAGQEAVKEAARSEGGGGGAYLELGPLLGHVSPTEAKIWAKASGPAKLSIRIGKKEDLSDAWDSEAAEAGASTFFSRHLMAQKLEAKQRYFYCVLIDGH